MLPYGVYRRDDGVLYHAVFECKGGYLLAANTTGAVIWKDYAAFTDQFTKWTAEDE